MVHPDTAASDLAELLQHNEWRSQFDHRAVVRGDGYARSRRVQTAQFEPPDSDDFDATSDEQTVGTLHGHIQGKRRDPYTCDVQIMVSTSAHRLYLVTDCSCPVGVGCKHAAAMLIALERRYIGTGDDQPVQPRPSEPVRPVNLEAWQRWFASLSSTHAQHADAERQFGILLRAENDAFLALPAWLRPSKSKAQLGVLVDPQAVQRDDEGGAVPLPAGGWPADVASDLAIVLNAPEAWVGNQHWKRIRSPFAEQALERLLARYPAWYERGSKPLTRAEPLLPELYWQEDEQAMQRLGARLPVDDAVLLQASGTWYVRPRHGTYGRVEDPGHLLQRLRYAPQLDPRQAAAVHRQLAQAGASATLPPPVDHGEPIIVQDVPAGAVRLRPLYVEQWNGRSRHIGIARVTLDYAGIRVSPGYAPGIVRHLDAGRVYEVQRRPDVERELLAKLEALGLKPAAYNLYDYHTHHQQLQPGDQVLFKGHQPAAPEDWKPTIALLENAGFRIEYDADFPHDELVAIDDWYGELTPAGNAWFDVALGIVVGGERIDLLPILRQVLADPAFPLVAPKGEQADAIWRFKLDVARSIELPLQRLRSLIEPLLEWLQAEPSGKPRIHTSRAGELDAMGVAWLGGDALRAQLTRLAEARQPARKPRGFKATLRPYQSDGLAWLNFLGAAGLGGILADDMGLGKTVQVLAHILTAKQQRKPDAPALVVVPTSLVGNWRAEATRFAPSLKVLVIHGADRARHFAEIPAHDLVITTYPLLPRDRDPLVEAHFSLLVLDEAQAIKNAHSQAARVVREIRADRRLAMTGTPLENHLGELWAQFDAVEPGLLGSERQFTRMYRTPIEKHGDADRQYRLNRRIGALLLRRRKEDVLKDLPAKNEIVRTLEINGKQRELYETLRLAQHERVREAIAKRGLAQAGIIVLDALLKLRQACCDPRLVKLVSAHKVHESAKLDALLELLAGLLDEGRRVLLFSQFTEMLGLIQAALDKQGIPYQILTGQTPAKERTALVARFQTGQVPLFLISLKAGGLGLNLTAADTVIHYDPWWNPAVEAQATDRAHRIGQHKPVFVYRLICAGTVEEKIQALQTRKAALARAVLEGGSSQRLRFDEADLAELFAPS